MGNQGSSLRLAHRVTWLLVVVGAALAAGEPVAGHRFVAGEVHPFRYDLTQEVAWQSGGDRLTYRTTLAFDYALYCIAVAEGRAELEVRLMAVWGSLTGPGARYTIDSRTEDPRLRGDDDPLLGNLLVMVDTPFRILVDPATGAVAEVRGAEALAKALDARHPGQPPEPPPLAAAGRSAFDPTALARLWSRILAVPRGPGEEREELDAPITGTVRRSWEGAVYHYRLDQEDERPTMRLHQPPNVIALTLQKFSGEGRIEIADGRLRRHAGSIDATWSGEVQTQALIQEHRIRWQLVSQEERSP